VLYLDSESTHLPRRFYRTVTNHLITPFTRPTGPFAVGKISFLLSDPSRTNRYNIPTNSSFMVSYWYPADAGAGQLPGIWEDKPLALDPNFWGGYNDRVPYFVAHSLPAASISTNQSKYPVIIYVPGYTGTRAENQEKFEDLASHGYIVISADTWEVYGTVFPDGRYLHGSSVYAGEGSVRLDDPAFARVAFDRRIRDVRVVLADLDRGDLGNTGLASHADTNNIGLIGFSFGGGVAGEMCRTNDRCKAALFLDPGGHGADELVRLGLQKPWLMMTHTADAAAQSFFDKATSNAVWFDLSNIVHSSFVYGYETVDPSPANRELQRTMKAYILSFFDKYLKGRDNHLLDGPSTNFPRVINFQVK
jgi:dienelactone hydrolase